MDRRDFIGLTGAAAVGAWLTFASGELRPSEDGPFTPWQNWTQDGEPKTLNLIRAAILAASPHNTQPWRFHLTESRIDIYLERSRSVSGLDPYLREAYLGLGCALENLILAACAHGYHPEVALPGGKLDAGDDKLALQRIARVDLVEGHYGASPLVAAIPRRRTNRSIYDRSKELPAQFAAELAALDGPKEDVRLFLYTGERQQEQITQISSSANFELYSDSAVEKGSNAWIRWRTEEVRRFRDGLTIDTLGLSPFMAAVAKRLPVAMLEHEASPASRAAMYAKQMRSARMIGIIAVRDRLDRRQSLLAGRLWQRAHLLATLHNVGARPCNEAIEMIDHERFLGRPAKRLGELNRLIQDPSWEPTFLFLMGRPMLPANLSPRRSVETVQLA